MHFYNRYPGDFMRETVTLSALEVGIYNLFLDAMYASEKPLSTDHKTLSLLARIGRTKTEKLALFHVLEMFFLKTENGYFHERVSADIKAYQAKHDKAKRAAAARWSAENSDANASAEHAPSMPPSMPPSICQANKPVTIQKQKHKTASTGKPPLSRVRARESTAAEPPPSGSGGLPDELAEFLRSRGIDDATGVHASVRLWAVNPAVTREVLEEGITRLQARRNVRHPMDYLATLVAAVLAEREQEQAAAVSLVPRDNARPIPVRAQPLRYPLTPAQQISAKNERVARGLCGYDPSTGKHIDGFGFDDGLTVDIQPNEESHELAKVKHS